VLEGREEEFMTLAVQALGDIRPYKTDRLSVGQPTMRGPAEREANIEKRVEALLELPEAELANFLRTILGGAEKEVVEAQVEKVDKTEGDEAPTPPPKRRGRPPKSLSQALDNTPAPIPVPLPTTTRGPDGAKFASTPLRPPFKA
jgi:hypothetical protein